MALFPFRVLGQLTSAETSFIANLVGLPYAQGDILYYNGTNLTRLPAGTNGWFLKTQGPGANPTWVAVPGGGDMLAATYDALGISGQLAGVAYANVFTKSQAMRSDSDALSLAVRRFGAAQTANIFEIQTEANALLASFDKSGNLTAANFSGSSSGTNTGDNATNSQYSGLVTNATHTGEVTGATALTVDKTAITGKTAATAVGTDYVLISDTDDSGNLKKALVSDFGGSATEDSSYYLVAANDATTKEKALADYQCDGTADEVQINAALSDVKNMGGVVILSSGTFNCAATVALVGETANSVSNPLIRLWGVGSDATMLNMASNVSGITITQEPKFDIGFLQIVVKGTAHGILQTAGTERGNHQSHLHDINIITDFTSHNSAYWGIKMESPFRMRFTNIEMNGVANGMWLTSHTDSFNPGNLTGDRIFIDLWDNASVSGAIGFKLSVLNSSSTGHFNLTSWNMVHIAGGSNLTSSVGIQLVGATGSYGETRQHDFNNMNLEDVKTAIEMTDASDCSFTNIYYTRVLSGGTFFKLNSGSLNNWFENAYLDTNTGGATFVVIDDSGNDSAQPNVFNRLVGYSSGTTTLNGTLAASTVIENMALTEGGPTIDSDLTNRNNNKTVQTLTTTGGIELGHASDTTITRVSAGVGAIEGNNIVTANMAASASNINTGTSTTVFNTPDALAGSNFGIRYAQVTLNGSTALTTSEKAYFRIPAALTGMNLVSVAGTVGTGAAGSSSSGTPTFTVKNVTDNQQMLSTSLTIDSGEYTSATAATAAVINATYDDVATDDLIEVAVTTSGTGVTYATITLGFQLP